jgi:hypothetical protein
MSKGTRTKTQKRTNTIQKETMKKLQKKLVLAALLLAIGREKETETARLFSARV